jgi:hypothetical protein
LIVSWIDTRRNDSNVAGILARPISQLVISDDHSIGARYQRRNLPAAKTSEVAIAREVDRIVKVIGNSLSIPHYDSLLNSSRDRAYLPMNQDSVEPLPGSTRLLDLGSRRRRRMARYLPN